MTSYNIYPDIPKEPLVPLEPQSFHLNIIQSKQQGLLQLGERFAKKYSKFSKILGRLVWLSACSSILSVAIGISNVVILITFIGLPVSIPLRAVSLAGTSVRGVATALTSKHQKRLTKVTKLIDIVMSHSIPTGYIPPGNPGKNFLSELIPATRGNFLSNSLPRGKK